MKTQKTIWLKFNFHPNLHISLLPIQLFVLNIDKLDTVIQTALSITCN